MIELFLCFPQILQISPISLSNYRFRLADWRKDKDWLNITTKSGIVFIQNALLMTNRSSEERNILWWKKNGTLEISGSFKLIINIDEGINVNCNRLHRKVVVMNKSDLFNVFFLFARINKCFPLLSIYHYGGKKFFAVHIKSGLNFFKLSEI